MKKYFLMLWVFCLALVLSACPTPNNTAQVEPAPATVSGHEITPAITSPTMDAGAIIEAFGAHRNLPLVQGAGVVTRLLKDDTNGSRHQ